MAEKKKKKPISSKSKVKKKLSPAQLKRKKERILKKRKTEKRKAHAREVIEEDSEMVALVEKMEKMQGKLDEQVLELCDAVGVTKEEVESYLNNPDNFPAGTKERIDQKLDALRKKIGGRTKKKTGGVKGKVSAKATARRGKKMIGARKKWLKM